MSVSHFSSCSKRFVFVRAVVLASSCVLLVALSAACSRGRDGGVTDGGGGGGGDGGPCLDGTLGCAGRNVLMCLGGAFSETGETCPVDEVCVDGLGCRTCSPGGRYCVGNAIHICNDTGDGSTELMACADNEACRSGTCVNACDAAREDLSNVGCEYWAVDLDNEYSGAINNAAAEQFAVVLANPSPVNVSVYVEKNDAPIGAASPSVALVGTYMIPPQGLTRIDLPQREVDCSTPSNLSGIGTCVTGNAYKITTNYPVVAYQFNPIIQSFSNDASLLIPATGLDTHYRVIGWPTANPIELPGFPVEGIPDHSYVTVVATQPSTTVNVTLGGPIVGNPDVGITAANAGDVVTYTLQQYEVLNLSSRDVPGDMTGTVVTSDKPIAVFSGGERAIAPRNTDGITPPPSGFEEDWCCTEHLEEQVFPTVSWGTDFVVTRSPVRSDTSWREPDIYRIMADKDGTTVTTNLPAPNDSFTLDTNQWREVPAHDGFILRADKPVSVMQMLVSQGFLPSWKPGHGGDPSMVLFPPYQQYRDNYIFLVPDTFSSNYVVLAIPEGTMVLLDGMDVNGDEFRAICTYETVGDIDGTVYIAATCPVSGGAHRVESSLPSGIMVYGYYNVGSYGYAGGSNLTRINFI